MIADSLVTMCFICCQMSPNCVHALNQQAVWEAATICPAHCKLTFDLLTLKVVSESRVTWATSVPILVFLGLSVLDLGPMNATDRGQTDVRQTDCLRTATKTSIDSLQKVFIVILQANWSNATAIKYRDKLVLFASSEKHKSIDDVVKRRIVAMCVILDLAYSNTFHIAFSVLSRLQSTIAELAVQFLLVRMTA